MTDQHQAFELTPQYHGRIVATKGRAVLIEGLAMDSGTWFVKAKDGVYHYTSRQEAEAGLVWDAALAGDAENEALDPLTERIGEIVEESDGWWYYRRPNDDQLYGPFQTDGEAKKAAIEAGVAMDARTWTSTSARSPEVERKKAELARNADEWQRKSDAAIAQGDKEAGKRYYAFADQFRKAYSEL